MTAGRSNPALPARGSLKIGQRAQQEEIEDADQAKALRR